MDKKYYLRAKGRSALEKISDLESQGFDVPSSLKRAAENAANFQGSIKTEKQIINYHKKKLLNLKILLMVGLSKN